MPGILPVERLSIGGSGIGDNLVNVQISPGVGPLGV